MRRPFCIVCDEEIQDEYCYVLDEFDEIGSCVCESCMDAEKRNMRHLNIYPSIESFCEEALDNIRQRTPEEDDYLPQREMERDW